MSDDVGSTEGHTRQYPKNADLMIQADPKSHRHYFRHDDGNAILSTPATDVEQARQLAADEFPSERLEDFELITDLCRHGKPRDGVIGCWSCTEERIEKRQQAMEYFFESVLP